MSYTKFKIIRVLIALFVGFSVAFAVVQQNIYLAIFAIVSGIVFMVFVKRKLKVITVDECIIAVAGHASRITYGVSTFLLAMTSLVLIFISLHNEQSLAFIVGQVLSYIALFNIAVYSIAFYYFDKKYGFDGKQD
jgi:uncharacterized membrane protein